jgi:hypothetical protein
MDIFVDCRSYGADIFFGGRMFIVPNHNDNPVDAESRIPSEEPDSRMPRCGECWRNEDVTASHFRVWEFALVPLFMRPFRCHCCGKRFYAPILRFN